MKKKPFLLCFFLILTSNFTFAQEKNQFLVLLSKGENLVKNETQLEVGQEFTFSSQDFIEVKGELILRQIETGNVAFFTESKNYTISEITSDLDKVQREYGFNGIYCFFGEHQLKTDSLKKIKHRLTGNISAGYIPPQNITFELSSNDSGYGGHYKVFKTNPVRIIWKVQNTNVPIDSFKVEIRNVFGEEIESHITSDFYYDLQLDERYNEVGEPIAFVLICPEGEETITDYRVELQVNRVCNSIFEEIKMLYQITFPKPITSAEDKVIESLFFEMRALYPDAARCLAEAIHLSQTDEERKSYEKLYDSFLHQYFPLMRDNFKENYTQMEWLECR